MSIQTAKEIHCDGCGEWIRSYSGRAEDAWRELCKEGWTRSGGFHYCNACASKNILAKIVRFRGIDGGYKIKYGDGTLSDETYQSKAGAEAAIIGYCGD